MFPIVDITKWERLRVEQMGTKAKFWCADPSGDEYLFKASRSHAGEHWSEKVASEIAAALGLPHASIELAICEGRLGTISRTFLASSRAESLIHGNELLLEHDPDYPAMGSNFRVAEHTLDRIIEAIDRSQADIPRDLNLPQRIVSAKDLFVGYLLLDALIGNTDRHHENWGVIRSHRREGAHVSIAPTFDHASSLGRELTDRRRRAKLAAEAKRMDVKKPSRRDQTVVGYLEKSSAVSRIYRSDQSTALRPMEVFASAYAKIPDAAETWIEELSKVEVNALERIVAAVPQAVMTDPSRGFALCLLKLNRAALISRTFQYE